MKEFQLDFMLESMLPYFSEIYMPIMDVKNPELQLNNIPEEFYFLESVNEVGNFCKNELKSGTYIIEKLKKKYSKENRKLIYIKKDK